MAWEPRTFSLETEQECGAFVFFSYAHQDKRFRDRLENHLCNLKYRGLITTWHDRKIRAGEEWMQQIDICLDKAHIILLLISADFMASEYCYGVEMKRALERHEQGKADVIPVLLRPVLYTDAPFAKLQMLPANRKPITRWRDRDSAFFDIACGIERAAQKYSASQPDSYAPPPPYRYPPPPPPPPHRRLYLLPVVVGFVAAVLTVVGFVTVLLQHPTLNPLVIYLFIGLLLLIAGVVAVRKVIGVICARSKQRRVQEAREEARKRRYYEEAIEAYRRALSRNPSDGDARRGMGNALYALGYYDQALDAFTRAIDYDSTPAAYAGLGDVYTRLKRYSEAVVAYERAIALDPTVTLNYDDFMRSLRALGRKEEAEQVHARVKQLGYEDEE